MTTSEIVLLVFVLLLVGLVELINERIATKQAKENSRLHELLQSVIDASGKSRAAEIEARAALNKLIKFYKKESKALRQELEDMEELRSSLAEESESEEEETIQPHEHSESKSKKRVESMLIAMQHKMRHARELVEMAELKGTEVNTKELTKLLDTSLDALEKDVN